MDGRELQPVTIEPRTMLWAVAEVSWEDAGGLYKVRGTLEDTSQSGACVRVKRPFTIGSRITIKWHREQFSAVTRNCRSDGYDFLLGVKREPTAPGTQSALQSQPTKSQTPDTTKAEAKPASVAPLAAWRFRPLREITPERLPVSSTSGQSTSKPAADSRTRLELFNHGLPTQQERTDMQPKRLFPHFWRRPLGGDVPEKAQPKEAPVNKSNGNVAESSRAPQNELLSYDDIYRAAGIMSSRSGYGIHKVVDMLNSDRIRDLSPDAKRASVLMALDAAGTSSDDLLNDALRRQSALDTYEAGQRKQMEDFEAHKNAENAHIEAELEKVRAHYNERMQANRDQVAREKDALRNWQAAMQHESQRIKDVIDLCGKRPAPAPKANTAAAAAGAPPAETGPKSS